MFYSFSFDSFHFCDFCHSANSVHALSINSHQFTHMNFLLLSSHSYVIVSCTVITFIWFDLLCVGCDHVYICVVTIDVGFVTSHLYAREQCSAHVENRQAFSKIKQLSLGYKLRMRNALYTLDMSDFKVIVEAKKKRLCCSRGTKNYTKYKLATKKKHTQIQHKSPTNVTTCDWTRLLMSFQ